MARERKDNPVAKKSRPFAGRIALGVLALFFIAAAAFSSWKIIVHTTASTNAIEKILNIYGLKNEAAKTLAGYRKEHPFLGFFISSPVKSALGLPSNEKTNEELGPDVKAQFKIIRDESSVAAWWSWFLLSLSLVYVVAVICLERSFTARSVLFALTASSVSFFFIGILAPAMVIWTAPTIHLDSGDLDFVVQHQVRGIFNIIWELLTGGHWIIGGFLLLFSIVTPMTKASLTFFVTASQSKDRNLKVAQFLHAIGKWSMADVFVAAVLLALYALKFQEATKSIPCLGLYYFIGYCLLSLTTTELLVHSNAVAGNDGKKSKRRLGLSVICGLIIAAICFAAASSLYTYEQYTENIKETIKSTSSPKTLDNANLVLPIHKK
jgi:paraquat-inducible protein A